MHVRDLMATDVLTAHPDDSVSEVARRMADRRVGAVVLCEGPDVAGIFTDRDFLFVAAKGLDPREAKVRDYMTAGVETVPPRADVDETVRIMVRHRFRHLPVVERGSLVGIVSMRDLLTWAAREIFAAEELAQIEQGQEILSLAVEGNDTPPD